MGGELHRELLELHPGAGPLAVERQRHPGLVGEVEGQVVGALHAGVRPGGEHRQRRLLERDRDDPGTLGELLAGAQEERDAGPAPVVDLDLQRDEGLGVGVLRDLLLAAVAAVLAADDVMRLDRLHRAEHLELLVADRARQQRGRRLHRHERQHLHQVGDHHVAVGTGGLVERRAALEAERLGHVDLHMLDEVAVPDRLEQAVGEAEREDVLRRLLAQEVVDPEDLRLVEDLVHLAVEGDGGREVGAERLLHDDPGPLHQAGLVELVDHVERRLGRDREVVQEAYVALDAELRRGLAHRVGQRVRSVSLRDVGEHRGEPLPLPVLELALAELGAGDPAQLDELRGVDVLQRRADDPGVLEQARLGQLQQPRHELAPGEVAGRTEEHDDVRGGHGVDARAHKLPRYYAGSARDRRSTGARREPSPDATMDG